MASTIFNKIFILFNRLSPKIPAPCRARFSFLVRLNKIEIIVQSGARPLHSSSCVSSFFDDGGAAIGQQ